ncbi:MAG TPA: hypothetical protein EYG92_04375 [Lutibacter sp.]|nr:hypothetical protein [Lutibacter sp.]
MAYIKIVLAALFIISITSCTDDSNFIIEKGRVGELTKETKIEELATIFKKDSLVVTLSEVTVEQDKKNKYFSDDDEYTVFSKEGKKLLTIIPIKQHDSLSTIKSVEIFSDKYKTKEGVSLYSPFKDIRLAYSIDITNTLLSAHVDIDKLNATMSIDKKEIGINEFNRESIIVDQIPDLAQINHFTIWFN